MIKQTLLFGNGINQMTANLIAWKDLLSKLLQSKRFFSQ
jgi:hypothetical protein